MCQFYGSDGLVGVRLPPDTEIIKYTSSMIGPKIPGTTNRGRKKTISLDHHPTLGQNSIKARHQNHEVFLISWSLFLIILKGDFEIRSQSSKAIFTYTAKI